MNRKEEMKLLREAYALEAWRMRFPTRTEEWWHQIKCRTDLPSPIAPDVEWCWQTADAFIAIIPAACRASAAPEGIQVCTHPDYSDWDGTEKEADFRARKQHETTLPSDSGKAAPVAWRWKAKGNKHWIYDPSPAWLEDHFNDPEIEFQPLYAALAPATEGGGREVLIAELICKELTGEKTCTDAGNWQIPMYAEGVNEWCAEIASKICALSPSPSVGTPEMPSAQRGTEA